jgi:methylmalonyl-CoA/ethylmalonyl-CoA epimerase
MADASGSPGVTSILQIAVNVKDTARAVRFYRDTLGLRLLFEAPPNLAFFDCGGVRLMLSPPAGTEFDHASSLIYYKVPDIRAAHATMKGRGVEFLEEPHLIARMPDHELWMASFRDGEGNVLGLMSEVR